MNEVIKVNGNIIEVTEEAIEKYNDLQYMKAVIKMKEDLFKKTLQEVMEEHGVKKIEMEKFSATLVPESTYMRFNSRKFKKENPELHKAYQTESKRRGYLRIETEE